MARDMKEVIAMAAKKLLIEKGVKKLTVKDIVEECQITRQAFYYHFEDIPDCSVGFLSRTQSVLFWKLNRWTVGKQNCGACLSSALTPCLM